MNPSHINLHLHTTSPRKNEPVTCGIPWPKGMLSDPACLVLKDDNGTPCPLQSRVLNRWSDGSVRWLLLDWQATVQGPATFTLQPRDGEAATIADTPTITANAQQDRIEVDTAAARFLLQVGNAFPFASIHLAHAGSNGFATSTVFSVEDENGIIYQPRIEKIQLEEAGPLRACVLLDGKLLGPQGQFLMNLKARLHFFAGSATVRFALTMHNPRKAGHPGGYWSLGSAGSVYLRDASLVVELTEAATQARAVQCSEALGQPLRTYAEALEIYQDSSGGENWQSSNHLNRHGIVPHSFRGYRINSGKQVAEGLRATPILAITSGNKMLAGTMRHFWQNFPKSFQASSSALRLSLFPRQFADVHEIQGGEQKTHTFAIAYARDGVTEMPLDWCRSPALAHADPQWYCSTGALPYLTPKAMDQHSTYKQLVDAAIEGDDTFERKREVIDEYGWRHFGDIYGDHEAVRHKGSTPLVSHYNNQYDPIAGFGAQFMRSGDLRWFQHMNELAAHVVDIDIYHTDEDKSAYNHGLFWHTVHYVDAGLATHRTYPKAPGVVGGGPACEQNYISGLVLHYYLTGDAASSDAALELAQWVIDMDEGHRTVFRWLDRGYTGLASATRTPDYHGPGRGSANSVAALVEAHRLTGQPRFLEKAEQLIRRCCHPRQDITALNLLDAENRWFYTMFLQSLGKYLDHKAELGQLDRMYAYARATLLHFARWMAEHEYPYLEKSEILEFPTETWAAQDMRKSEVFKYAALHADGEERQRFLERADYFFHYSTETLAGMPTRMLARPVVLLLGHGFMHDYFKKHPDVAAPRPAVEAVDFGPPERFVPQKVRAKKRFLMLAGASAVVLGGLLLYVLISWVSSWSA